MSNIKSETPEPKDRRAVVMERLVRYTIGTVVVAALMYTWFAFLSPCAPRKHAADYEKLNQITDTWNTAVEEMNAADNPAAFIPRLEEVYAQVESIRLSECLETDYTRRLGAMKLTLEKLKLEIETSP